MKNAATLALVALLAWGCSTPPEAAAPPAEFKPVTSVREMMEWIMDPSADVVWGSVGTIISTTGTEELVPRTDEEWANVRNHAAIIAESGNLLLMERGIQNDEDWAEFCRGLVDAAVLAIKAAEARDKEALFDAGGRIYAVCAACHTKFMAGAREFP